ncbi:hypothetical protein C8Q74DRAFT_264045 [Fomes fomentarius]|nr:hypothetical protein C8Q74DRAFT_264045 [Fomes fomentarius]
MSHTDGTYGALFIGVLVSAVLFGVTMLQTFVYFSQYPSDRAWRKLAVCWLWFLDAVHLALSAHFVYYYLVVNYDNPSALLHMTWSFKIRTVIDGLVVVSVHTLYTSRLWTLLAIDHHVEPFGKEDRRWSAQKTTMPKCASRFVMRRVVPWLVGTLVAVGYAITIVMCYETFKLESFDRLSHAPWATYIPYCFSTVIDIVIAGSLCYFLARCRPESGPMNGPIKSLMFYTLNTGIISSVCSLVAIAMMVAFPTTFIPVAIEFLVIKLYINSYLAMVNARGGPRFDHERHMHSVYNTNTSIALRDVVQLEQKPIPFSLYPSHNPSDPSFHALNTEHHDKDRDRLDSHYSHSETRKSVELLPIPSPGAAQDIVVTLSRRTSPETVNLTSLSASLHAPRMSHPDVRPEFGLVDNASLAATSFTVPLSYSTPSLSPGSTPARVSSLAERLAITPPPVVLDTASVSVFHREPTCPSSASTRQTIDLPSPPASPQATTAPSLLHSPAKRRSSSYIPRQFRAPLSPSRSSPHPFSSSSTSLAAFGSQHPSTTRPLTFPFPCMEAQDLDFPSAPERTLSPLRFGSPPASSMPFACPALNQSTDNLALFCARGRTRGPVAGADEGGDTGQGQGQVRKGTEEWAQGEEGVEVEGIEELPMVYASPRDRYTRMVRTARSKGKARRALFDERGVAVMWGLQEESAVTGMGRGRGRVRGEDGVLGRQ